MDIMIIIHQHLVASLGCGIGGYATPTTSVVIHWFVLFIAKSIPDITHQTVFFTIYFFPVLSSNYFCNPVIIWPACRSFLSCTDFISFLSWFSLSATYSYLLGVKHPRLLFAFSINMTFLQIMHVFIIF